MIILLSFLQIKASQVLQSVFEDFNNNKISEIRSQWSCSDSTTQPDIFRCTKGMNLVKLQKAQQLCSEISVLINTLLPHFKIQFYIDLYGYNSIDCPYDQILIYIDDQRQFEQCFDFTQQVTFQQCNQNNGKQFRKTYFTELNHNLSNVKIKVQSKANQDFNDESYLFRNVQLLIFRCDKFCKICNQQNTCTSCYYGQPPYCESCKNSQNGPFLDFLSGQCVSQCSNNQGYDSDQVCDESGNIQSKCEDDCLKCTNTQSCLECQNGKYIHQGQCLNNCPYYTIKEGSLCLISIDKLDKQNFGITQIFKEFYDLSTTKDRINDVFNTPIIQDQYNFKKGDDIYFSYLSNKRIFGGPFVWVNSKFQFTKSWIEDFIYVNVFFEVILGDTNYNDNTFIYKINDEQSFSITLNEQYQFNDSKIEDQTWPNDYKFNIYVIQKTLYYQNQANKQLKIEFDCQGNQQLDFCGIQNFIVNGFYDCEFGYKFHMLNFESFRYPCIPICGDKIIVREEECDDGNNDPFDGCFNCRFDCEEHCAICIKGECLESYQPQDFYEIHVQNVDYKLAYDLDVFQLSCIFKCNICINNICLECNFGYYLNTYNNLCVSLCGDSILQDSEQCDDGNIDNYDGCSDCELIQYEKCDKEQEIQIQRCSVCHFGKCLKCNDGYILNDDICVSSCGDGLLNIEDEECDSIDEGCFQCKIKSGYVCGKLPYSSCKTCDLECTQCFTLNKVDLICNSCSDGYFQMDNKCYMCDLNCITCKIQSSLCTSCYKEDCDFCESIPGLYSDLKSKKCMSICGDGIQVEFYEQCDDNNILDGDGCDSQFNLELSNDKLALLQNYTFNGNNTYDLQILPSAQLYLLCETSKITIDNIDNQYYNYTCIQIDNITCRLQFNFQTTVYKTNIIHVKINYASSFQVLLLEDDKVIQYQMTPNEFIYLKESEVTQMKNIKDVQSTFSYYFLIMIPISIVINLFDSLWTVLEIISWINNFYFLNVNYPFNVEIFFLNVDWQSFISIPTYKELNQPGCNYYFEAPKKFKDKGIDPLFFNNIQTPFMFILSSIIIYFINIVFYFIFSFLNDAFKFNLKKKDKHLSIFNISIIKQVKQNPNKENYQVVKENLYLKAIYNFFRQNCIHFKNQIKQTVSLCLLDITLAILLQLSFSQDTSNIIVGLNQFFAFTAISILIYQLYQQNHVLNIHKLQAQNKHFKKLYGVYYENINPENSFGYYYQYFLQISKIMYIYFMVNCYYSPILQVSLCYLSCSLSLAFLIYQNPYDSKKEFLIDLGSNFCLSTIILIIILFAINDEVQIDFIEENKIILGWLIISLVVLGIFIECCVLLLGLITYIYKIFKIIQNIILKFYDKVDKSKNEKIQIKSETKSKPQKKQETQISQLNQSQQQYSQQQSFSVVLF